MSESRVKAIVMLTVLTVWAVVVSVSLANYYMNKGELPDPILLGIPSATWLALHPPTISRSREEQPTNEQP